MVSVGQLYELGLSDDQVRWRIRAGWLHPVFRGAVAVGRSQLGRRGLWMAAVLACGDGAALSHFAAAELWTLLPSPAARPAAVDISVPTRAGRRQREGIRLHRCKGLSEVRTASRGIPVTTVERTIIDLAPHLRTRRLERAIDEAHRLRLTDGDRLRDAAARHGGRRGIKAFKQVLERHTIGSTLSRSELEERFLALCRSRGLPQPAVNATVHGLTVDFLWTAERVVVETDGRGSHDTARGFQVDRDRDSLLAAHGHATLRFTWWDVTARPAVVAHRLNRVLETRRGPTADRVARSPDQSRSK